MSEEQAVQAGKYVDINLPEIPTIRVFDRQGRCILEQDPIILDIALGHAQIDIPEGQAGDPKHFIQWITKFRDELNKMTTQGYKLGVNEAHVISVRVNKVMLDLQKNSAG